jgi:tetratricopeptide (TPR) repeat protein
MTPRLFVAIAAILLACPALVGTFRAEDSPNAKTAAELFAKSDWANAARAYETLTKANPKLGRNWYRLGMCRLALKQYTTALADFEASLARGAPEGPVRLVMARAQARLGNKEAALDCLEKSAKLGFASAAAVRKEDDLSSLREEPRFKALLSRLENPTKGMKGADALDHWIGEWDVFVGDQKVGQNRIIKSLDGFAVEEFWEGGAGRKGRSLFVFEAANGQWRQLWTSDTGWVVQKVGVAVKDGIYLEGNSTFANGTVKKSREYLTRNADGSVRQLLEDWDEKAKAWKPTFDAKYVRKRSK